MIKNLEIEGKENVKNEQNIFNIDVMYISFYSVKGCTLSISAAFPAETEVIAQLREKPRRNLSNKELRKEWNK